MPIAYGCYDSYLTQLLVVGGTPQAYAWLNGLHALLLATLVACQKEILMGVNDNTETVLPLLVACELRDNCASEALEWSG